MTREMNEAISALVDSAVASRRVQISPKAVARDLAEEIVYRDSFDLDVDVGEAIEEGVRAAVGEADGATMDAAYAAAKARVYAEIEGRVKEIAAGVIREMAAQAQQQAAAR